MCASGLPAGQAERCHIDNQPWLKQAFLAYLLLGVTDTVHHLHAAIALGHAGALHAVWAGVVLIPMATFFAFRAVRYGRMRPLAGFITIALLATLVPGMYHGGWEHLLKILAHLRIDHEATRISSLLPAGDVHLWFYEVTGSTEFFMALVCGYYCFRLGYSSLGGLNSSSVTGKRMR